MVILLRSHDCTEPAGELPAFGIASSGETQERLGFAPLVLDKIAISSGSRPTRFSKNARFEWVKNSAKGSQPAYYSSLCN